MVRSPVELFHRKRITLDVNREMNISTLKKLIKDREGIPIHVQHVTLRERSQTDEQTLAECDIDERSIIVLDGPIYYGRWSFTGGRQTFD